MFYGGVVVLVGWGGLELPPMVEAYIGILAMARCGGGWSREGWHAKPPPRPLPIRKREFRYDGVWRCHTFWAGFPTKTRSRSGQALRWTGPAEGHRPGVKPVPTRRPLSYQPPPDADLEAHPRLKPPTGSLTLQTVNTIQSQNKSYKSTLLQKSLKTLKKAL